MYKISRLDGNVVVLSRKYVDELQNIPSERLSLIKGLIKVRSVCLGGRPRRTLLIRSQNFGGLYSGIGLLAESDIGTRAIQV
jgi:cytochrome P450 monooxygenase